MRLSEPPTGVRPVCDFKGHKELKVAASCRLAMSLNRDPSKMGKRLTDIQYWYWANAYQQNAYTERYNRTVRYD